jgi:hypothetical protein
MLQRSKQTCRVLQKYMHGHADRDHAMCSFQKRTIPVVQLTQLHKLSTKIFRALLFSKAYSNARCFSAKRQHRQCRLPG